MPDIKVKGYSGNDLVYQNVDKIYFRKADDSGTVPFSYGDAVSKTIEPDFTGGDISVDIPDGKLVKEMTIKKPEDLAPENIRAGREIGGVPGEFIGDTEEVSVGSIEGGDTHDLNLAVEDLTIEPSAEGKVLSKVTIRKPADLAAENILAGKNIGGVVGNLVMTSGTETVIDPDFSGGNIEVTPAEGTHFSKVTVEKPDNLLPENIAEGIDIAGIIGTLVAGGGSESYQYKHKVAKAASSAAGARFSIDFGFTPDILFVQSNDAVSSSSGSIVVAAFGVSTAFAEKISNKTTTTYLSACITRGSNGTTYHGNYYTPIDQTSGSPIFGADATGFNLAQANSGNYYLVFAFGH